MGIRSISKRAGYGDRLIQLEDEGNRGISMLSGLTQTLPQLRQAISDDDDLSAEEKVDALADVDAVIAHLVTQVKEFANGL